MQSITYFRHKKYNESAQYSHYILTVLSPHRLSTTILSEIDAVQITTENWQIKPDSTQRVHTTPRHQDNSSFPSASRTQTLVPVSPHYLITSLHPHPITAALIPTLPCLPTSQSYPLTIPTIYTVANTHSIVYMSILVCYMPLYIQTDC